MVHSTKHYGQKSLANVTAGNVSVLTAARAVEVKDKDVENEVEEGCSIKAIYCEFWLTSDDAAQGSFAVSLERKPGTAPNITYAESITLNDYDNKKNILYTTMGLLPTNVGSPIPLLRGWFKIPKGKQRMGKGDQIQLNISAISNGLNYCGFFTFKEYT